jgi:hypothetical protein
VLLANGIDVDTMVEIIVGGLASATPQRTRAGREVLEVAGCGLRTRGDGRWRRQSHEGPALRQTDCVARHIGLEPANPGEGHLIGFA